ncbi:hypothetical protein PUN28_016886 [Cardiocondyla obscurior]|uniref:THAP-type domain-containing protein n=1 Tax=Cardiocondyla obscurior TaxID=286306 RepID=A0AAW2EV21_9HYME
MTRCIVVGCTTSGYTSNPEKVQFFFIPRNKDLQKTICHHHFEECDILWKRELYDEERNIVGVSAPYKILKLRKGAIPSKFPWSEKFPDIESDKTKETNNEIIQNEMHMEHELEDNSTNFFFHDVHTQINDDNTRLLIFFLPTCNKIKSNNSLYSFYSIKEVILKNDMRIQVNVLKQPILNLPSSIFYCPINSIDQLQKNIICFYIEKIGYNEAFKDISDTWRHKKCSIISTITEDKCQFCAIVQKSIHQKRRREKKSY